MLNPLPLTPLSCSYRGLTLVLTFLSYTSYHLSRKPISIVKVSNTAPHMQPGRIPEDLPGLISSHLFCAPSQSQLHLNCSALGTNPHNDSNSTTWCSWAPFGKAGTPEPQMHPNLSSVPEGGFSH